MLANNTHNADQLEAQMRELKCRLVEDGQQQGVQYMSVLQASNCIDTCNRHFACVLHMLNEMRSRLCKTATLSCHERTSRRNKTTGVIHALLQGLLQHTVVKQADSLEGMYKQAFDRIANQV